MELHCLTRADRDQALPAHDELAAEQFEFLHSYHPDVEWTDYLDNVEDIRHGQNLPEGHVPATFLVAEVEGNIVGRVSIRHRLNPYLRSVGEHVGYAVRPQFRRQRYSQQILNLSLVEAKRVGLDAVLVTCNADNDASKATIERCGGVLEAPLATDGATTQNLRYWIDN